MNELSLLIQWAFGGFWRWLGFVIMLAIVCGGFNSLLGILLAASFRRKGG